MAMKSKIPSAAMQKRIMKTGEVTDDDVEQYIKQVGMDTLQGMNLTPDNVKEYLKNITELGNKPKKKLPSKNKIDKGDSMLVVDGNDAVSKVKPDIDSSENVTFKSATKKAGEGSLDLGTAAFNKIFPNIGKFMGFVKNKFESQSKAAAETNASILGYSKEIEHSSDLLDSIVESGNRSNLILRQILGSASSSNRPSPAQPTPAPGTGNQSAGNQQVNNASNNRPPANTPSATTTPPVTTAAPRTTPPPAIPPRPTPASSPPPAAAPPTVSNRNKMIGAGVTVAGGAAILAAGGGNATPSGRAPNAGSDADAELMAEGSGKFQYRGAAGNLLVEYSNADGKFKIDNTEVDRAVYLRFMQLARLMGSSSEQSHPRYQQFLQEARAADDLMPEATAREKVRDLNIQELMGLVNRVRNPTATPAPSTPTSTSPARTAGATPMATRASPTTRSANSAPTPAAQTSGSRTPSAAMPISTPNATGFDTKNLLHIKAKKIVFKADRFEYSPDTPATATSLPAPMGGGGGSSPSAVPSGGSSPAPTSNQPASGGDATQSGAANLSGLDFAGGVDQRIKPDVAEKTKSVQSAFGKKLIVTSGFRDAGRNSRAGGAEGSKHLTGDAVDVQFSGNEQDTINLIKVASEKGIGGIGVYRPGFLHFDTGSKRVWGPDYKAGSIPQWAKPALDEHMGKPAAAASGGGGGGGAAPAATQVSTPPVSASGSAPAAASPSSSPVAAAMPSTPSSGAAVSRASTADEAATRTPPATSTPTQNAAAPSSPSSPSAPAIDPNNPGELEPPDAALRYSRLFNMVA